MTSNCRVLVLVVVMLTVVTGAMPRAQDGEMRGPKCRRVQADLVEDRATTGCKPGHPDCFLGEVDGNRGFRGTTYFRADSAAAGPSASPSFISYSGLFEYQTERGTIFARETGVFDRTVNGASSGALTAYQHILSATGDWEGVTGHFFVSGFNRDNHIVTRVSGEVCLPD